MTEKILADSFIEIVSKASGISLDVVSNEADGRLLEITGVMNLNGKEGGTILVSASEPDIRVFCSEMTGVPRDSIQPEEISDAVCELVNMTAGSTKLRLGSESNGFTLSTPFSVEGGGARIATKKRAKLISLAIGNGELFFKVKMVLN